MTEIAGVVSPVDQRKTVPPPAVSVADVPWHIVALLTVSVAVTEGLTVTVPVAVPEQPLASVTTKE